MKMPKQVNTRAILQSCAPVETAENQIAGLLAEIQLLRCENDEKKELEEQINRLREQLQNNGGRQKTPIDLIFPNPNQPRKTFSDRTINELAHSLKRHGQLQPVILIPQSDGAFIIFDGECRWRAAQKNQWTEIDSVLTPNLDFKELQTKALVTTIFREDLNALDRAEAILNNIEMETGIPFNEAESIIKSCIFRLNRYKDTAKLVDNLGRSEYDFSELTLSESEIRILTVLLDLGINPASFCSQDLKALHLPDDLKLAIRQEGLQIQHSFHLSRLSAKNLGLTEVNAVKTRKKGISYVLKEKLSVRETSSYVSKLISKKVDSELDRHHLPVFFQANRKIIKLLTADLSYEVLLEMELEMQKNLEKIRAKMDKKKPNS
jgi:ParB family chromosome partitioning protein